MSRYTTSKKTIGAIIKTLMKDYLKPETITRTIYNCILINDDNIQEIVIRLNVENDY